MDNTPHLHILPTCHNLHICLCSLPRNILHHNLRACVHYQSCHKFHQLVFPSPLLLWPVLSKIPKLRHQCLFWENEKIRKLLFTLVFCTSTDDHWNSGLNRTRSPGSFPICKPAQLTLGENILWLRSLKRPYGITLQMSCCRRFNVDLEIQTSEQPCCLKSEL